MSEYFTVKAAKTLGRRLLMARVAAGYTAEEVASSLGQKLKNVEAWELDKTEPSDEILQELSTLYNTPVYNLVTGRNPPPEIFGELSVTEEEKELIERYRNLRDDRRHILWALLDNFKRFEEEDRSAV